MKQAWRKPIRKPIQIIASSTHVAGSVRWRLSSIDVLGGQVADAGFPVTLAVERASVVGVATGAEFTTPSRVSMKRSMRNNRFIFTKST